MRIKNKYGKRTVKQPLLVHFKLGPDSQRAVLVVNQYYLFIHFSRWALVNGASSEILKIIALFFLLIICRHYNSISHVTPSLAWPHLWPSPKGEGEVMNVFSAF